MPAKTTPYTEANELQRKVAAQVIARDEFDKLDSICAVDVAYDEKTAYCSAIVVTRAGVLLEVAQTSTAIEYPYVPGFLMLRETPPVLKTLAALKSDYDLLLVDGHGQLHPRKCGIASYLGVTLGKPTIGVAKSLLCGKIKSDGFIELDGEILGCQVTTGRKKLYVSVGHRISLKTAVSLVGGVAAVPEALRLADQKSKLQKKEEGLSS